MRAGGALRRIFSIGCILALSSCGMGDGSGGGSGLLANRDYASGGGASTIEQFRAALDRRGSTRSLGTDEFLGEGAVTDLIVPSNDGSYTLNLVNVPIEQAAQAVLGNALGRNYTIQPGITGEVTLQTSRPLSERLLLETFETVLELNGATLRVSDNLIQIVPANGGGQRVVKLGNQATVGARIVAVPLEYIGTAEMIRLLGPIAGETIRLEPIPNRNILLIAGSRQDISSALDAVNLFDVDVLKGKSVGLFKLNAAEPQAVVEELGLIFETQEGGGLQNVVTFVPSERLGAIIVITSRARYLDEAERWIRDLDRTAGGARRRPVVYSLQNRSAADLAPILTSMIGEIAGEDGGPAVEGQPRVVADDSKNAVIVWGNDTEQSSFSQLIRTLDTRPVQVLLEATVAEVTLNDELNFGLRWFFENGDFSSTFTDASSGAVSANFPGLSFLFQGSDARVALNALNSVTNVNIVSSPSLMVVDNQEARLQIGDEVPIATQQVRDTSDPNAPVVNTISFRDTGIILTVRPRVSSSGQVALEIEQEVSSVSNTTTSGIDSPTISQRKIKTNVVVSDGQTIALGGLIEEGRNRNNSKVPGAGDVPVLGGLFRNRSDRIEKTELLVLITPRVVRNGHESRSVTNELRRRIQGSDGLVRNGIPRPQTGHRILR